MGDSVEGEVWGDAMKGPWICLFELFLDALLTGQRALDGVLLLRAVPVPVDWVIRLRARVSCKQKKTVGFSPILV
jgi:hypothetical protein